MMSEEIPVHAAPGSLPAFWDRQAVFVANLLGLFFDNEEGSRALAQEIGEADSYGGRLLPIIELLFRRGGNLLVLEHEPDPTLSAYFTDRLGLSLPAIEVLSHREYLTLSGEQALRHPLFERLRVHQAPWIDGYVTDEILGNLAGLLGKQTLATPAGSHRGNNKRLLFQDMQAAGMPIPATFCAGQPAEIARALSELQQLGFRSAVIKSAIGASGIGLRKVRELDRCDLMAAARDLPDYFLFEGDCLIQGWIEPGVHGVRALHSPSVQMFVADDEAVLFDITEQILSHHSIHEGNESPPPYLQDQPQWREELLAKGIWAARWLHRQGYRGTASADFLVIEHETLGVEIQICELNARVTGATYPSVLARHFLPHGSWLLRNLRFESPLSGSDLLATLDASGTLFTLDPSRSSGGVLPINFNFGSDGLVHKGQFLCLAANSSACHQLLETTCKQLPCVAERD